jgi:ankyrin repeat protein
VRHGFSKVYEQPFAPHRNSVRELVKTVDKNGWSALHEAVRSGELDAVLLLVRAGADVKLQTKGGMTALSIARSILYKNHPVTQYLIKIGAPEGTMGD